MPTLPTERECYLFGRALGMLNRIRPLLDADLQEAQTRPRDAFHRLVAERSAQLSNKVEAQILTLAGGFAKLKGGFQQDLALALPASRQAMLDGFRRYTPSGVQAQADAVKAVSFRMPAFLYSAALDKATASGWHLTEVMRYLLQAWVDGEGPQMPPAPVTKSGAFRKKTGCHRSDGK